MRLRIRLAGAFAVLVLACVGRVEAAELPIFDAHLHYSHDAWDVVPPAQAIAILRRAGVKRALISSSGDDGQQRLLALAPDLVITDVMMPRMDGITLCQRLREDIRTAFVPVMMLTANADETNRTKGYLVGTDDYVNKPFSVPDLNARVMRLLRRTYGL